jgi:hypothetical protein
MKSVLVINTPKSCYECYLLREGIVDTCLPVDRDIHDGSFDEYNGIPSWCPLKPLPKKMPMRDEAEFYLGYMNGKTKYLGFNEGYNACLEDILGGE